MKKLLYIFIAIGLIFQACDNDSFEDKFDKNPDQRIKERIQNYSDILTSPQYGWKTLYYPNEDSYGGYQFLINFDEMGNASIISDLTGERDTSLFKVKAIQDITLAFETYSQLHKLTDPIEGSPGDGIGGDFEFLFDEVTAEKVVLKGRIAGSKMVLYPATETTEDEIMNMNIFTKFLSNPPDAPFFREINVTEGVSSNISFSYGDNREVTLTYKSETGEISQEKRKIHFTSTGFSFKEPLTVDGKSIENFAFNLETKLFDIAGSDIKGSVTYSNAPAFPVVGAADALLASNFYVFTGFSDPLNEAYKNLKASIPGLAGLQLYVQWGYLLAFDPTRENKHAGFSDFVLSKAEGEEDLITTTWEYGAFGDWWGEIYNEPNNAGKIFLQVITDPEGMYVVPSGGSFYLVSKSYPSYYFKIEVA